MSVEEKGSSAGQIGTLGSCLIEGDSEQKSRERKVKRRAMVLSIALQAAVLVALVLVPLLGRTEKLPFSFVTPMPPYRPMPNRPASPQHPAPQPPRRFEELFVPTIIPPRIVTHDGTRGDTSSNSDAPDWNSTVPVPGVEGGTEMLGSHKAPERPEDPNRDQKRRISVGGAVQQAMLTRRVEPPYPPLARQLRHSGAVHLRAIISTEGNIESLQILDGDPLLVQSARDAVLQWHYRPTYLNGQPVEVETIITVIYSLNQ